MKTILQIIDILIIDGIIVSFLPCVLMIMLHSFLMEIINEDI